MDRIDETENDKLQLMFAECVYASGVSFHSVTSKRWEKFFARIRPNFKPPNEKQLSTGLLEKSYQKNVKTCEVYLEQTNHMSLVIDTWKNIRKDTVISIVAMTPAPILVKSIDTKGEKDVDDIFPVLDEIIKKLGPRKITGLIVTDEKKILNLREKVMKEYKHIVFSGCSVHKLNDLIKKICELVPIENIVSGTKEIVNEINGNQKLHEKYREMVKENKSLSLFSGNRFSGSVLMISSVIGSMTVLKSLAEDSKNEISEINRKRILSLEEEICFNQNLLNLQNILKPISDTIHEMESSCHSMADMIEHIKKLEKIPFDGIKSFGDDVVSKVTTLFNDTMSSIKTPPALLSNILHPFYRGKNLSIEEKSSASIFVGIFSKSLYMNENSAMESYQQFINGDGHFSQPFLSMDSKRVISWWKFVSNMSDHNPLCEIAMRLLNVQPTITSVERIFSKQKYLRTFSKQNLDSKDVNLLPGGKMNKLVYINSNINIFDSDLDFNENNHESEHDNDDEGSGIDLSELCCSVLEYMDHSSNE